MFEMSNETKTPVFCSTALAISYGHTVAVMQTEFEHANHAKRNSTDTQGKSASNGAQSQGAPHPPIDKHLSRTANCLPKCCSLGLWKIQFSRNPRSKAFWLILGSCGSAKGLSQQRQRSLAAWPLHRMVTLSPRIGLGVVFLRGHRRGGQEKATAART